MPDQQRPPAAKGKVLGMPRTTGLVVIAIGAVVVGYFVISRFSGGGSPGGSQGGGGTVAVPGPVQVIRQWQPRQPRRPHHHPRRLRPPWRPQ